ncbi:MAG: hypothetical protein R8M45_03830 [Ghiorsea sp.]
MNDTKSIYDIIATLAKVNKKAAVDNSKSADTINSEIEAISQKVAIIVKDSNLNSQAKQLVEAASNVTLENTNNIDTQSIIDEISKNNTITSKLKDALLEQIKVGATHNSSASNLTSNNSSASNLTSNNSSASNVTSNNSSASNLTSNQSPASNTKDSTIKLDSKISDIKEEFKKTTSNIAVETKKSDLDSYSKQMVSAVSELYTKDAKSNINDDAITNLIKEIKSNSSISESIKDNLIKQVSLAIDRNEILKQKKTKHEDVKKKVVNSTNTSNENNASKAKKTTKTPVDVSHEKTQVAKLIGKNESGRLHYDINAKANTKLLEGINNKSETLKHITESTDKIKDTEYKSYGEARAAKKHLDILRSEIKDNTDISETERDFLLEQNTIAKETNSTLVHMSSGITDQLGKGSDLVIGGITSAFGGSPLLMFIVDALKSAAVRSVKSILTRRREHKLAKAELLKKKAHDKHIERKTDKHNAKDMRVQKGIAKDIDSVKDDQHFLVRAAKLRLIMQMGRMLLGGIGSLFGGLASLIGGAVAAGVGGAWKLGKKALGFNTPETPDKKEAKAKKIKQPKKPGMFKRMIKKVPKVAKFATKGLSMLAGGLSGGALAVGGAALAGWKVGSLINDSIGTDWQDKLFEADKKKGNKQEKATMAQWFINRGIPKEKAIKLVESGKDNIDKARKAVIESIKLKSTQKTDNITTKDSSVTSNLKESSVSSNSSVAEKTMVSNKKSAIKPSSANVTNIINNNGASGNIPTGANIIAKGATIKIMSNGDKSTSSIIDLSKANETIKSFFSNSKFDKAQQVIHNNTVKAENLSSARNDISSLNNKKLINVKKQTTEFIKNTNEEIKGANNKQSTIIAPNTNNVNTSNNTNNKTIMPALSASPSSHESIFNTNRTIGIN